MDAIVERLRQVGFSLYEARLYATLLRHGSQNGNELSRNSGVPSSKVYAVVEKLVAEGSVQRIASPGGTRFVALPPDELVDRLRRRFNDPLDYLAEKLPPLADHVTDEVFLSLSGEGTILESARRLVSAAHEELNISLWEPELEGLRSNIVEAAERGVRIFGMLYSATAAEPEGTWLRHSYEEIVGDRVGGRMLTLVADGAEALVARLRDHGGADGVRTLIVSEYLHHDLVLQRAQIDIGFDEWDRWWLADPELRGQILGRALGRNATARAAAPAA
jgi:HTH-type transcriptional regulator, sugar sensing transcriptional regulator